MAEILHDAGTILREQRKKLGLTQRQCAERAKVAERHSSMISSIGYDFQSSTLEVEFKNGAVWDYPGFPEYLWYEFEAADSKGK